MLLAWALQRRAPFLSWAEIGRPIGKSLLASLMMGAGCWLLKSALPASPYVQVPALLAFALPAYYCLAAVLGIEERHLVWSMLSRNRARP